MTATVKNWPSNAGDLGLFPGQWTKIPHTAGNQTHVWQLESLHAATKTQCSLEEKEAKMLSYSAEILLVKLADHMRLLLRDCST